MKTLPDFTVLAIHRLTVRSTRWLPPASVRCLPWLLLIGLAMDGLPPVTTAQAQDVEVSVPYTGHSESEVTIPLDLRFSSDKRELKVKVKAVAGEGYSGTYVFKQNFELKTPLPSDFTAEDLTEAKGQSEHTLTVKWLGPGKESTTQLRIFNILVPAGGGGGGPPPDMPFVLLTTFDFVWCQLETDEPNPQPITKLIMPAESETNLVGRLILGNGRVPDEGSLELVMPSALGTVDPSNAAAIQAGCVPFKITSGTEGVGPQNIVLKNPSCKDPSKQPTTLTAASTNIATTIVKIDRLEFEQAGTTGDLSADTTGYRFFPDAATAQGSTRNIARVRAVLKPNPENARHLQDIQAAIKACFRTFDVDDSSADTVIDPDGNGRDNRGTVNGTNLDTPGTPHDPDGTGYRGRLREPEKAFLAEGAIVEVQPFLKDGELRAEVELATSFQPGDNFRVAASLLKDKLQELNENTSVPTTGDIQNFKGKATSQLSVWRTLHIELDSMGTVANNLEKGKIVSVEGSPIGSYKASFANALAPDPSLNLDSANPLAGRFQNGTIHIGTLNPPSKTFPLLGNGNAYVRTQPGAAGNPFDIPFTISLKKASKSGKTLQIRPNARGARIDIAQGTALVPGEFDGGKMDIAGHTFKVLTNQKFVVFLKDATPELSFELYDDDNLTLLSNNPDVSLFAGALAEVFIAPKYDVPNPNPRTPFVLNLLTRGINQKMNWDSRGLNSVKYWVAYVWSGYQPSMNKDCDPNNESWTRGETVWTGGSVIYRETIRDLISSRVDPEGTGPEGDTVVHEVGHTLNDTANQQEWLRMEPVTDRNGHYLPNVKKVIRKSSKPRS